MRLPIWAYAAILVVVLAGLGGVAAYIRHEGYRDGQAAARAEFEAERQKLELANRTAVDVANRRLIQLADQLSLKELQVDDYVKALDLNAAEDTRAGELCLDVGSVRRLNTIR